MRRAILWGVDFIQIREKDLTDRELFDLTRRTVALTRGTACRVLVNGRADVARAAGAHGIHLPSASLAPGDLHPRLTHGMIVGISTHSLAEARRAAARGAHYILLGPVYPTPSKLPYGSPMGLRRFGRICSAIRIPVLGLGGIRSDSIDPVLDAGAAGVAGISLFQRDLDRLKMLRGQSSQFAVSVRSGSKKQHTVTN